MSSVKTSHWQRIRNTTSGEELEMLPQGYLVEDRGTWIRGQKKGRLPQRPERIPKSSNYLLSISNAAPLTAPVALSQLKPLAVQESLSWNQKGLLKSLLETIQRNWALGTGVV
jgi:hypothetical protein